MPTGGQTYLDASDPTAATQALVDQVPASLISRCLSAKTLATQPPRGKSLMQQRLCVTEAIASDDFSLSDHTSVSRDARRLPGWTGARYSQLSFCSRYLPRIATL